MKSHKHRCLAPLVFPSYFPCNQLLTTQIKKDHTYLFSLLKSLEVKEWLSYFEDLKTLCFFASHGLPYGYTDLCNWNKFSTETLTRTVTVVVTTHQQHARGCLYVRFCCRNGGFYQWIRYSFLKVRLCSIRWQLYFYITYLVSFTDRHQWCLTIASLNCLSLEAPVQTKTIVTPLV